MRKTIIEKTNIKNLFIKNPKHTEDRCTPSDSNPLLNHDILLSIILIIIVNNHEFLSSLLITFSLPLIVASNGFVSNHTINPHEQKKKRERKKKKKGRRKINRHRSRELSNPYLMQLS